MGVDEICGICSTKDVVQYLLHAKSKITTDQEKCQR